MVVQVEIVLDPYSTVEILQKMVESFCCILSSQIQNFMANGSEMSEMQRKPGWHPFDHVTWLEGDHIGNNSTNMTWNGLRIGIRPLIVMLY